MRISDVPPDPGPYALSDKTATNWEPAGKVRGKENENVEGSVSELGVMFW